MENQELEEFLQKHFEFPSDNMRKIRKLIRKDPELEKIIRDLPEIVSNELAYRKISLDFMKETDPGEKILEIIIRSDVYEEVAFHKEDRISDWIIDNYPKTASEFIILVESL